MNFCEKCGSPENLNENLFYGKYCLCQSCLKKCAKYWEEDIDYKDVEIMRKISNPMEIRKSDEVWERNFLKFLKHQVWSVS